MQANSFYVIVAGAWILWAGKLYFRLQVSCRITVIVSQRSVELHNLASGGDAPGVLKLIREQVDIHERDVEGRTALHWAADRGHAEVVKILLKAGLDSDLQDFEGQSPLHYAALCEHEKVILVLS